MWVASVVALCLIGLCRLALQHTATQRNAQQRTATHGNTLQHTATHCNTLQYRQQHLRNDPDAPDRIPLKSGDPRSIPRGDDEMRNFRGL